METWPDLNPLDLTETAPSFLRRPCGAFARRTLDFADMPILTKVEKAGHSDKGNLAFAIACDDGRTYTFERTPSCFVSLFAMGWQAASTLPGHAATEGISVGLHTQAQFAMLDTEPGLVLISGPLTLAAKLGEEQTASIQKNMADMASTWKKSKKH